MQDFLTELNERIDEHVKSSLAERVESVTATELPSPAGYAQVYVVSEIASVVGRAGYDTARSNISRPTAKNEVTNDYDLAFNVAGMAKEKGEDPRGVAAKLAAAISELESVTVTECIGPFVNVKLDYGVYARRVVEQTVRFGEKYGFSREGDPRVVVIDYSSPNIAKDMTVAHLRSTIIGHSLMNIREAAGDIPYGISHIGDWGSQFGGIFAEYFDELERDGEAFLARLEENPTAELLRLYRNFRNKEKSIDPDGHKLDGSEGEALKQKTAASKREYFRRMESGDPELVELWGRFREWNLDSFTRTYEQLGVSIDATQGESFFQDRMAVVVKEGLERGVLVREEDGTVIFPSQPLTNPTTKKVLPKEMLGQGGVPHNEVIVGADGNTMYLTRDLAAIRYRRMELGADEILYVIGKEQKRHCLMLFTMADQLGYAPIGAAEHLSFGHLNLGGEKMSSRDGKQDIPTLEEVLNEAMAAAAEATKTVKERFESAGKLKAFAVDEDELAREIGVSAVVFNDLKRDREGDIEFDSDTAKTLEAGSSQYIQYANARLNSLFERAGELPPLPETLPELSLAERNLIRVVAEMPLRVREAADHNNPHRLASYLTSLAQETSVFYDTHKGILKASDPERAVRLNLLRAAQTAIQNSAKLLHIDLPERM